MDVKDKKFSPEEVLQKAASYCAYQERCHEEVKNRLSGWGLYGLEADQVLLRLIELGYLNEERFAKAFAGGKFRISKWGRVKIELELKARKVSDYCIAEALKEIEEGAYLETLKKLALEKGKSVKETNPLVKNRKIAQYLVGKGYEANLVWNILKDLFSN